MIMIAVTNVLKSIKTIFAGFLKKRSIKKILIIQNIKNNA